MVVISSLHGIIFCFCIIKCSVNWKKWQKKANMGGNLGEVRVTLQLNPTLVFQPMLKQELVSTSFGIMSKALTV